MGAGLIHEGSLRAEKRENDAKSEAFEQFCRSDLKFFFGSKQQRKINAFRRSLFLLVICPLTETSKENKYQ